MCSLVEEVVLSLHPESDLQYLCFTLPPSPAQFVVHLVGKVQP